MKGRGDIYGDVVRFDLVLESLPPGEQKTGTLLSDTVLKPWADATRRSLCTSIQSRARLTSFCTGEQLIERENEIVAEIVRRNNLDGAVGFDGRERARKPLADPQQFFGFYRTNFLMLDSAPADRGRFKLTFEDCVDAAD